MSWTARCVCTQCQASDWSVKGGIWTCVCGKPMTTMEIKEMQTRNDELST